MCGRMSSGLSFDRSRVAFQAGIRTECQMRVRGGAAKEVRNRSLSLKMVPGLPRRLARINSRCYWQRSRRCLHERLQMLQRARLIMRQLSRSD